MTRVFGWLNVNVLWRMGWAIVPLHDLAELVRESETRR